MSRWKEEQEKGRRTQCAAMQNFSRLPVFLLSGGSEASRGDFVRRLMFELTQKSLAGVFLKRGEGSNPLALTLLARQYDLVIVDSGSDAAKEHFALGTICTSCGGEGGDSPWSLGWEGDWGRFIDGLLEKLGECGRRTPVWACVLIGGRSSRMGRPKHLIKDEQGKTWLENTIATLQPLVDGVVVSGAGVLPEAVAATQRIPDVPGVVGPLTGILAAGRWQPLVSWLLVACDMPHISVEAVSWLLAGRRPGRWGRVPKFAGNDRLEPLLAWYDFRSLHLFEGQLYSGNMRIGEAAGDMRFDHPTIPEELRYAWENINTPEQLQAVER